MNWIIIDNIYQFFLDFILNHGLLLISKVKHLMISSRVSKYKKTWLIEWGLKLVGECSGSVPSSNCMRTSVLSKLQNSPLTIRPSRLNNDILRILDTHNYSSSQLKFLPCFTKVNDVDSWKQTKGFKKNHKQQ